MKLFLITLLISNYCFSQNLTPRKTFKKYLSAMVSIKNSKSNNTENYEKAISTFDLSSVPSAIKTEVGKKYANQLIKTIDKIKKVNYQKIPDQYNKKKWYFHKKNYQDTIIEISLVKIDKSWFFSQETFESLKLYKKMLKGKKNIKGVKRFETLRDHINSNYPKIFSQRTLIMENWQWIGIFILLMIAFFIDFLFKYIATKILNKNISIIKNNDPERLKKALKPFGKILFVAVLMNSLEILEFDISTLSITKRVLIIMMSVMSVWFAHRLIELLSFYASQAALNTKTKFDDIMIPLLTKTAYVLVYLVGIVLVANSFTIDVTGIVAGLGIGGLAFAFAAKDTLANFFGSIMLVLDRPFDIGDVIITGDVEGVVNEVGFRSTRIRTFQDSIITISNGELMNRPINNLGKRRYRRLSTTLGVEYDTTPEMIEAFCEGIRQLILSYKWTRKDYFNVYFTNYGPSSLDIQVMVFWETSDYTREQAEKHRLNIDILRLAKDMGINFAFPTQTIHMFSETKETMTKDQVAEYFDDAINRAKNITAKPLSLKNPRSNATDKEHFGDNDIGI